LKPADPVMNRSGVPLDAAACRCREGTRAFAKGKKLPRDPD
jgi:hypothetical protein